MSEGNKKFRQLTFLREKETKNKVRFFEKPEEGQPELIGTLYVAKWFAGGLDKLKVIIEKVN
ncbi:MAG: hypothetical protein QXS27_03750 [Candidatus Jordarchaeaceae archaeon]